MRLMTKFSNYKLHREERELVWEFERYTRCDLMSADDVVDILSFKENLDMNIQWYRDNVQETLNGLENGLENYYAKMTNRRHKIAEVLKTK